MKNSSIWIGIFIVIVWILLIFIFPFVNKRNNGCSLHREIYTQEIRSIVIKKFIDTPNHDLKKIIYSDGNRNENELVFTPEYKSMYDSLNIGDSIIKAEGTLYYRVKYKGTGKERIFKFYTLCKDSIR